MRAQKSFSDVALASATVLCGAIARTAILKRCVVQPQAVTSDRN
jgi:hypothetical protein